MVDNRMGGSYPALTLFNPFTGTHVWTTRLLSMKRDQTLHASTRKVVPALDGHVKGGSGATSLDMVERTGAGADMVQKDINTIDICRASKYEETSHGFQHNLGGRAVQGSGRMSMVRVMMCRLESWVATERAQYFCAYEINDMYMGEVCGWRQSLIEQQQESDPKGRLGTR
jgi:hypothetical protein